MDIHVRDVPPTCPERVLKDAFRAHLRDLGVHVYACEKVKGKRYARLTLSDARLAKEFLAHYGMPNGCSKDFRPPKTIEVWGVILKCSASRYPPNQISLSCLAKEDEDRLAKIASKAGHVKKKSVENKPETLRNTFNVATLETGIWDYRLDNPIFFPYYQDSRTGSLVLGRKFLLIILRPASFNDSSTVIRIPYYSIDSLVTGDKGGSTITMALTQAPVFHRLDPLSSHEEAFANVTVDGERHRRSRICGLHLAHLPSAGNCLVYRLFLKDKEQLAEATRTLTVTRGAPGFINWPTATRPDVRDWNEDMAELTTELNLPKYAKLAANWPVKFQLQRLAQNGFLRPYVVRNLIQPIHEMLKEFKPPAIVEALRSMSRHLPYPGPYTEASVFEPNNIMFAVRVAARRFRKAGSAYALASRHSHLGLVHKVLVSPTGLYLEGPDLESKNRVLRKYNEFDDFFLRVTFMEEDGQPLKPDFSTDQYLVYERFKGQLNSFISIGGRSFTFLGFSHSSLRSQQCWFMAPFLANSGLVNAEKVIQSLGDFTSIRSPAKCAARIGQAFSDATDAIVLGTDVQVLRTEDIERRGYCFTDGVGSISEELLKRIWKQFTKARKQHATILQVRYQGAKGLLTLNTELKGKCIELRQSMIKFEGSSDASLEITGAAYKKLPMYLNRQFIKILEDLGVPAESFLDLQSRAISKLYRLTDKPINAAHFIDSTLTTPEAHTSFLIRTLDNIGLNFRDDAFLKDIVDMAALTQLRDIKYRGRIPLDDAYTLYGVADWTGTLQENEVHIAVANENGQRGVLEGDCLVTRSPALHPGDIQWARAVGIAPDSPLRNLHNCIIFSTNGPRDLPSQLAGGDLDGDLYNIIFDRSLWPQRLAQAAQYPRPTPIDIRRSVERVDITDFFLKFMQSDQLGYIANVHLQLADAHSEGTFHQDCITLAGMASTAVDFSKTGIPVDMSKMPSRRSPHLRPDFMAVSPRLVMDENLIQLEEEDEDPERLDATDVLEPDVRKLRFYKSKKVLGTLYRAVDETRFLENIEQWHAMTRHRTEEPLITKLWKYIERETKKYNYTRFLPLAQEIKDFYDEQLREAMHTYSPHRRFPLSELEAYIGTILGRDGGIPPRRTRDAGITMKEHVGRLVRHTFEWIAKGSDEESDKVEDALNTDKDPELQLLTIHDHDEPLCRSIACLAFALSEEHFIKRQKKRNSDATRKTGKSVTGDAPQSPGKSRNHAKSLVLDLTVPLPPVTVGTNIKPDEVTGGVANGTNAGSAEGAKETEGENQWRSMRKLKNHKVYSFKYIAATACLREMQYVFGQRLNPIADN